jgi:hypothetical protein
MMPGIEQMGVDQELNALKAALDCIDKSGS